MKPYNDAIATIRSGAQGKTYAATESVFDDMANALGMQNRTPEGYQAASANEAEPSPADLDAFLRLLGDRGVDVLIATPGRLLDLIDRGSVMPMDVSILVIDEADRMLDMGFIPDIETIVGRLPAKRQTLMFSATMAPPIRKLADKFLNNPKEVEVARAATTAATIGTPGKTTRALCGASGCIAPANRTMSHRPKWTGTPWASIRSHRPTCPRPATM